VRSFAVCAGSLALVSLLARSSPAPAQAQAQATTTFALRVSTAADADGKPVASEDALASQIAAAQELFAPFGVGFARTDGPSLDAHSARIETREDRNALASRTGPHGIDVFVVESLRDVDTPDRMRRGVHWHAPSGAHYLILVATAPPTVLAHELGHYFGNPHSQVVDNVMSYERSGAHVFFDAEQGKRIAARAAAYVRSRELLPIAR
jgi:hypothetical protein